MSVLGPATDYHLKGGGIPLKVKREARRLPVFDSNLEFT